MPHEDWTDRDAAFYAEAGALMRHYSSVRLAVTSLGLTILFGIWTIIYLYKFNPVEVGALAFCGFLIGGFVFYLTLFFSVKYEQARQYLLHKEDGSNLAGPHSAFTAIFDPRVGRFDRTNVGILAFGILLQITLTAVKLTLDT